jgi:hypothetical protein
VILCNKCGHEIPEDSLFCGKCGNKTASNNDSELTKDESVDVLEETGKVGNYILMEEQPKRTSSKLLLISILVAVLLLGVGTGGWYYVKNKDTVAKEQYESDLRNVLSYIIEESADAEVMINTYLNIWEGAIDSDFGIIIGEAKSGGISYNDTDKSYALVLSKDVSYAKDMGYAKDFNQAIITVRDILTNQGKISLLKLNNKRTKTLMKSLNDPPDEFKIAYEAIFQLYGHYEEYISMAESPSGSLTTYKQKTGDLTDQIIRKAREFNIRLPSE